MTRKMNDLPDELFVNITLTAGMFGMGADAAYICTEHRRHIPCRPCIYGTPATTPYVALRPYLADVLLDALREEGVYAYADNPRSIYTTIDGEINLQAMADFLFLKGFRYG